MGAAPLGGTKATLGSRAAPVSLETGAPAGSRPKVTVAALQNTLRRGATAEMQQDSWHGGGRGRDPLHLALPEYPGKSIKDTRAAFEELREQRPRRCRTTAGPPPGLLSLQGPRPARVRLRGAPSAGCHPPPPESSSTKCSARLEGRPSPPAGRLGRLLAAAGPPPAALRPANRLLADGGAAAAFLFLLLLHKAGPPAGPSRGNAALVSGRALLCSAPWELQSLPFLPGERPPPSRPSFSAPAEASGAARYAKGQYPPTLTMVREAVQALNERKGSSTVAIKRYIRHNYPGVDPIRLKYYLRKALLKGLEKGYLVRPLNSSAQGATGRFKLAAVKAKPGKVRGALPPKGESSSKPGKTLEGKAAAAGNPRSKGKGKGPPFSGFSSWDGSGLALQGRGCPGGPGRLQSRRTSLPCRGFQREPAMELAKQSREILLGTCAV
ncbi:atherin-like [Candoia aspera]|uniref:atherin-like n=1 Tax=Candoia aspera TaxID=51853 RepID=UPI002FD80EDF